MKPKNTLAVLAALSLSLCGIAPALAQVETFEMADDSGAPESMDFVALTQEGPVFVQAAEVDQESGPEGPTFIALRHGEHGKDMHHGPLEGALAITDDQAEKLHKLHSDYLDDIGPKDLELHKLQRHMKDALMNPDLDSSKVKSMGDQIASLKADLSKMKTDHILACANVLTADQRKAVRMAVIRHHFHHHMGGGPVHHFGPGGPHPHPMAGAGPEGKLPE